MEAHCQAKPEYGKAQGARVSHAVVQGTFWENCNALDMYKALSPPSLPAGTLQTQQTPAVLSSAEPGKE